MDWRRKMGLFAAVVMMLGLFGGCKNAGEIEVTHITEEDGSYDVALSQTEAKTADGVTYYEENKIKVVSYNIRCANDENGNSIKERAPRLQQVIDQYDPDIMGFQEFVPTWQEYADAYFSDEYDYILRYRSQDNYEGTPVYWKRSKFKLLDYGTFWLSETPEVESKDWNSACYRVCTWLKLEVRQTGKVFYYYNTHFDYLEEPQMPSAELLLERIGGLDAPVILTGDFNLEHSSEVYTKLTGTLTDANTANDPTATFTDYGKLERPTLIDYTFVTGETVKPAAYQVMDDKVDGNFVSDHYGVYSEVILL